MPCKALRGARKGREGWGGWKWGWVVVEKLWMSGHNDPTTAIIKRSPIRNLTSTDVFKIYGPIFQNIRGFSIQECAKIIKPVGYYYDSFVSSIFKHRHSWIVITINWSYVHSVHRVQPIKFFQLPWNIPVKTCLLAVYSVGALNAKTIVIKTSTLRFDSLWQFRKKQLICLFESLFEKMDKWHRDHGEFCHYILKLSREKRVSLRSLFDLRKGLGECSISISSWMFFIACFDQGDGAELPRLVQWWEVKPWLSQSVSISCDLLSFLTHFLTKCTVGCVSSVHFEAFQTCVDCFGSFCCAVIRGFSGQTLRWRKHNCPQSRWIMDKRNNLQTQDYVNVVAKLAVWENDHCVKAISMINTSSQNRERVSRKAPFTRKQVPLFRDRWCEHIDFFPERDIALFLPFLFQIHWQRRTRSKTKQVLLHFYF